MSLPGRIKKYFKNSIVILLDKKRKHIFLIIWEYFKFSLTNKDIAQQYFSKYFYRKGSIHHRNFIISRRIQQEIWHKSNPIYLTPLLDNKLLFDMVFKNAGINVPRLYMYNERNRFYLWDNNEKTVDAFTDFYNLLISYA